MNLNTHLKRIAYGSPLTTLRGKLVLAIILITLFLAALGDFKEYYTVYPVQLAVGILLAAVLYLPTIIAVWYVDRREREPWLLALLAAGAVIFFFGPVAAATLGFIDRFFSAVWVVGFVEEFWKVTPLLLLVFLLPRAVGGWRDGLVYGALGGLGFAMLEYSANSVFENFPTMGWAAFTNGIARVNFLGTNNHIIWSAAIGAAIGWAVAAPKNTRRYIIPLAVYLAVAVLHILEDKGGNIATTMISGSIVGLLVQPLPNAEQVLQTYFIPIQMYFGTMNLILINLLVLPFLLRALFRSGDEERRVIRDQLKDEVNGAITTAEYEGVVTDRRYRTRKIAGMTKAHGTKVIQLQNELAFHKEYVAHRGGNPDNDQPVLALRKLIEAERVSPHAAARNE